MTLYDWILLAIAVLGLLEIQHERREDFRRRQADYARGNLGRAPQ